MQSHLFWVPLVPLAAAAVVDLRSREVPDWIPACLLVWSVFQTAAGWSDGWIRVLSASAQAVPSRSSCFAWPDSAVAT
ncbi:MAG: hypothetical protein QM736_15810 [Vicinamibacterales bacterium]